MFPITIEQFREFAKSQSFDLNKINDIRNCPIALALKHYIPGDWYVGAQATLKVKPNGELNKVYDLPKWAESVSMGRADPKRI